MRAAWTPELLSHGRRCAPGSPVFVPGGVAHTYRVLSPFVEVIVLSTPAGLETWTRTFGIPAGGPGLPPSDAAPLPSPARLRNYARTHGVQRLGPPPPAA